MALIGILKCTRKPTYPPENAPENRPNDIMLHGNYHEKGDDLMSKRDYRAEERAFMDLHRDVRTEAFEAVQNVAIVDGVPYNTETGEDLTGKVEIKAIASDGQRKGIQLREGLRKHQEENGGFMFAYYEAEKAMTDRYPDLTQSDMARLLFIGTYLSFGTNHLVYDNGKPMNKKGLQETVQMSRNKFGEFYKKLIKNGILTETETGLVMNPTVFYRGASEGASKTALKEMEFTRVFRGTIRSLYEKFKGRAIKKLGVIYAVLPHINFHFNTVCENPTESESEKAQPMQLGDLADKLGYDNAKHLTQTLRSIEYDGNKVFKFVEGDDDARTKYVIVNPDVVYAGNGKHLESIKVLFS